MLGLTLICLPRWLCAKHITPFLQDLQTWDESVVFLNPTLYRYSTLRIVDTHRFSCRESSHIIVVLYYTSLEFNKVQFLAVKEMT
jgi:hypothetical protein